MIPSSKRSVKSKRNIIINLPQITINLPEIKFPEKIVINAQPKKSAKKSKKRKVMKKVRVYNTDAIFNDEIKIENNDQNNNDGSSCIKTEECDSWADEKLNGRNDEILEGNLEI